MSGCEFVYISNSDNGHPFKVYCDGDNGKGWVHSENNVDFAFIRNKRSLADIKRIVELERVALELVATIKGHHASAYCDEFDYDELEAAKEALKGQGK